jgi:hypothetical protein
MCPKNLEERILNQIKKLVILFLSLTPILLLLLLPAIVFSAQLNI